jgi:carboxypeptidase Taq
MALASPYEQLTQEFRRLNAFRGALSVLRWDAAVMMPRASADVRGEQLAALETEYHAVLTAPKVARLIERAEASRGALEDWQVANLREMKRQRDHAIATPPSLVARLARACATAEAQWMAAREQHDFNILAPALDEVLQLMRDKAGLLGQALGLDPYDALLDEFSPGLTRPEVDTLFQPLSHRLPGLIQETLARQSAQPPLPLHGRFSPSKQRALCMDVMRTLGFPFDRGRLDECEQPFTEGVAGDVRVTTRFLPGDPFSGLLGALHETGHAMYDLGLPQAWRDQPVGWDRGMALEESQSLLLEQVIGRSRPFVRYLRPLLEKHYGVSGPEWSEDNLLAHLTRVRRGLVRVEADELTYPGHVMLRYELETRLLEGSLLVRDLPDAWDEGMEHRLGRRPQDPVEGCLQDAHWALGSFGYFPAYALGALIAAQLGEQLREDVPDLDESVAAGRFGTLFEWLRQNVHSLGASLPVDDLVERATGRALSAAPALRYLEAKYLGDG